MKNISLTSTIKSHLPIFFQNQADPEANYMAAFTPKDPYDKEAYISKWTKLLNDENITMRTILQDQKVVGIVCTFPMDNKLHLTYTIKKSFWGQGIATKAVQLFLKEFQTRPIHASTAFDNHGSMKVLLKNRFQKTGSGNYFANARNKEIEEIFFVLNA